jgi:hypothetical protein
MFSVVSPGTKTSGAGVRGKYCEINHLPTKLATSGDILHLLAGVCEGLEWNAHP